MRSGWLRGSIYGVLLFWDRFSVSKPLSQIQRRTLLFLQQASCTPSFGGLGLRNRLNNAPISPKPNTTAREYRYLFRVSLGKLAFNLGLCSVPEEKMAHKIALFNHKGGVSKTTTTFHLGWMLAAKGKTVILADADPQCN